MKICRASALVLLLALPRSAHADLNVRLRTDAVREAAISADADRFAALARDLLVAVMVPGGQLEISELISDSGAARHTIYGQPTAMVPRGAATIQRDGVTTVIDTVNHRYWALQAATTPFGMYTTQTFTATDEYETIAGVRARHFIIKALIARADGITASAMNSTADVWLTDEFSRYEHPGPNDAGAPRGFPMRVVLHGGGLGPYRITTTVISVQETAHDARAFEVPAGYVEVSAPPPNLAAAVPVPGPGVQPAPAGMTSPRVLELAKPKYTAEAMRHRIEGIARVSAVVMPDGTVQNVRIVKSIDATYGLDYEAMECVQASKFQPGTRNGAPVAVAITIDVQFKVR